MGEVATVCQGQTQDLVARLRQGGQNRSVCLRTGVRLDVSELSAEELLGTVTRQIFDDVNVLATTVVAAPWVALSVFVGEDGTLCLQNGTWDEVLRCDRL